LAVFVLLGGHATATNEAGKKFLEEKAKEDAQLDRERRRQRRAAEKEEKSLVEELSGVGAAKPSGDKLPAFRAFQRQYLVVYVIIMTADWLQGTNMYTLYQSYGTDISTLFITGFTSSAIFGTIVGLYVDRWGRKFGCIIYLLIEIVVNVFEHFNNFPLLMLGRVLGGVSTSLLFSAFESWMVSEHRKKGFPEEWLADTFSTASFLNGSCAIFSGFLAQLVCDQLGEIGPFQAAIAFTALALVFVAFWEENYGGDKEDKREEGSTTSSGCVASREAVLFFR